MRKRYLVPAIAVPAVFVGGVAWAALTGTVALPQVAQGIATPGSSGGCQTSSLAFTVPDPVWNNSASAYEVTTIDYAGIDSPCQNTGADLELKLVDGSTTIASATDANLTTAGGTLTLSNPVSFDRISVADFVYLVKG